MKEESMRDMIEGLEGALGIGQFFEPEVIEAFERSLEDMEEIAPEYKGIKDVYTNTLIEIMKAPQPARGVIITCLMHKCLLINEQLSLIEHENQFLMDYFDERLSKADNSITRLIGMAIKAKE